MVRFLFTTMIVLSLASAGFAACGTARVHHPVKRVLAAEAAVVTAPLHMMQRVGGGCQGTYSSTTITKTTIRGTGCSGGVATSFANPVTPPIVVIPMKMPPKK